MSYSSKSARTELLSRDDDSTSFGVRIYNLTSIYSIVFLCQSTNDGYDQVLRNTEAMKRATYSVHKAQEVSAETGKPCTIIINYVHSFSLY